MLFVSLPSRSASVTIPMAYICLAAWLEKKGIPAEILDIKRIKRPGDMPFFGIEEATKRMIEEISSRRPRYVGFTCYTADFRAIRNLGTTVKERTGAKIIVGGIHPTLRPGDFFFEGSPVDIAVIGEGEMTLSELIEKDMSGGNLGDVAGIMFRQGKEIIRTRERPCLEDLTDLPIPAYDKIDMNFYTIPQQSLIRWLFLSGVRLCTTRGCPYLCTFCANRAQKVRYRPVESVIEEIKFLKENYAIDGFYINDDTFCMDKKRTFEFLNQFKNAGLDKMVWGIETRVDLLDEPLISGLKQNGCIQIDIGVESGSQKMLDRVRKGIRVEDVIKKFEICHRYKMRTFACFMVNMPGETTKDIEESIKLMKRINATVYGINITIPYIGTKIYDTHVNPKLTIDEYDKYIFDNSFKPLEDKRFKLVSHNLNEKFIYYMKFRRFKFLRQVMDITLEPKYWRGILRSKRRLEYLSQFLRAAAYKLLKYPVKLLKTVNFRYHAE